MATTRQRPAPPAPAADTTGQWVWAPPPPGAPDTEGRWVWMFFGPPPPATPRRNTTGRIGLFVAGYFLLGLVSYAYATIVSLLGVDFEDDGNLLLAAIVSALFAAGLLAVAGRTRGADIEPLGIMAAFGSGAYVAGAAGTAAAGAGLSDEGIFWAVVLVSLPVFLAVLLWIPHPLLGFNVAAVTTLFVTAAPLGNDGPSVAGGKAVLLAVVLAALAVVVDLRTRSRAGSLLHYWAIIVLVIGKLILAARLDGLVAPGVIASIAVAELFVALMLRRRLWAVSGWITLGLAAMAAVGAAPAEAVGGSLAGGLVGIPLAMAAFTVQANGEELRRTVLDALPRKLAASFPL